MGNIKVTKQLKETINNMYFKDGKSTQTIAIKLDLSYATIMRTIDRSKFYDYQPNSRGNSKEEVEIIQNEICKYYNIPISTLHRKSRFTESVLPRQIAHSLSYDLTKCSNAFIGGIVGGKTHATVLHSRKEVADFVDTDKRMASTYQYLEETCRIKLKEYRDATNSRPIS